jgi:hypothetical protein
MSDKQEPKPKSGLVDTWSRLLSCTREIKKKRHQRNQGPFRGPTLIKEVKWSQKYPELISTEQYIYTFLADATNGVGVFEMIADNQDAIVRCLAKIITRLLEIGAIEIDELSEIINDYRHTITLKPEEEENDIPA